MLRNNKRPTALAQAVEDRVGGDQLRFLAFKRGAQARCR
jgi:hypothetical protein